MQHPLVVGRRVLLLPQVEGSYYIASFTMDDSKGRVTLVEPKDSLSASLDVDASNAKSLFGKLT